MSDFEMSAMRGEPATESERNAAGYLSSEQMATLLGVPLGEVRAEFHRQAADAPDGQHFALRLPKAWLRQGKERAALAQTDDMGHAIQILRVVDDLDGRWVDPSGAVWRVTARAVPGAPLLSTQGSVTRGPLAGLTVQRVVASYGPLRRIGGER